MRFRRLALVLACALAVSLVASSCGGGGSKKGGDDSTPPEPGQLLTLLGVSASAAQLGWAAATDDTTGVAALEYLAYRSASTANDLTSVASIEANGTPIGAYAAAAQGATATGLDPATAYWFSVIVRDEAGNKASYTPIPATTEAGCFADAIPGGCAAAGAGEVTVCGRLADLETGGLFTAAGATGAECGGAPTASGPCSLALTMYDALDFASNPGAAMPLAPDDAYLDDCGRYRFSSVPNASSGFFAVVIDDAAGTADRHKPTAVTEVNATLVPSLRAYVTRNETDAAWTTSASLGGGSFAMQGVAVGLFRYAGAPRAGVTFQRNNATVVGDDYYFSDTTPSLTTVDVGQGVTGSNGAALMLSSGLENHNGFGGEPAGCEWPSILMDSIPGVVFVKHFEAQLAGGGGACP